MSFASEGANDLRGIFEKRRLMRSDGAFSSIRRYLAALGTAVSEAKFGMLYSTSTCVMPFSAT